MYRVTEYSLLAHAQGSPEPFPAHGRLMMKKNAKALPYVLTDQSLSQEVLQKSLSFLLEQGQKQLQTC